MIVLDIKLKLNRYSELRPEAKSKAYEDYEKHNIPDKNTPKAIREELARPDYLFFDTGEMAETLIYTSGPNQGYVELDFYGNKFKFRNQELLGEICSEDSNNKEKGDKTK